MKNLERDRRRKKGAIGSQDGGFRTFLTENRARRWEGATCSRDGGADITVYSVCTALGSSFCKILIWFFYRRIHSQESFSQTNNNPTNT